MEIWQLYIKITFIRTDVPAFSPQLMTAEQEWRLGHYDYSHEAEGNTSHGLQHQWLAQTSPGQQHGQGRVGEEQDNLQRINF